MIQGESSRESLCQVGERMATSARRISHVTWIYRWSLVFSLKLHRLDIIPLIEYLVVGGTREIVFHDHELGLGIT